MKKNKFKIRLKYYKLYNKARYNIKKKKRLRLRLTI